MPLDAVCLRAVVEELRPRIQGLRIDKVQQPVRDQVILLLRGNLRLLLSAAPGSARIQLTETLRDNPAEPPMFCMLLRKHLVGGRVADITQPGLERAVELSIDITDDFGRPGRRTLILEAMGRRSNLILLDGERRIIDCLRRVDGSMSPQRQVLPGLFYELPPTLGKRFFTDETEEGFLSELASANPEKRAEEWLLDEYFGLSPLIARELVCRAAGSADKRLGELGQEDREGLWREIEAVSALPEGGGFTPVLLKRDGKLSDFTYLPVTQYGGLMEQVSYPSFSSLMDDFYDARERQERARQRGADLIRTATTARDRLRRKLALQEKDYAETQNRDHLRICGDLITANLYRMEKGARSLTCENYYDENQAQVTISLDPLLTPQQNAAKYYKRYAKAKTAEKYLAEQMDIARRDAAYLDSVLEELGRAETEQDFLEIRSELRAAGFIRSHGKEKKQPNRALKPRAFRTSGGLQVLVGRNNRQNDQLTLKDADYRDLWFHTQKIHGSHVILRCGGQEPAEGDVTEAALLAAYFSQAKDSANVPVDCAQVRYVKKPAGARPGMVTYSNYRTLYVTPEEEAVKRMQE